MPASTGEFRGIIIGNGNNLVIEGDMTRRVLIGKLDANMERPEERQFRSDPVKQILADRGRLVAAAMTIVRAYLIAGPARKLKPLASYGSWSDLVRAPLVWLDCADPVETMKDARESDPVLTTLRTVLECWLAVFGEEGRTAQQVVSALSMFDPTTPEGDKLTALRAALAPIATVRGILDATKLGYWLRASRGRPVSGLKLTGTPGHGGFRGWSVIKA
jgi:putative DNA primase/helicase